MRACASLTVTLLIAVTVASAPAAEVAAPRVGARASLVMDADSGAILWEDNGNMQLPPASTTKVLTSVLALESGRLDDELSVSSNAQSQAPSKLGLREGQQVRLLDLVYALMLKSANDAAVVVAEGLSGSVPAFAERMNARARQLGATGTRFRNPNGLPDESHVSTARDLALILRHALRVPGFRGIASTARTEIPVMGSSVRMVSLASHNRLLSGYVVPVIGKTGYTRAAGRCFVGAAELGGREVIVVVLGSSNLWSDTRRLIEFGMKTVAPAAAADLQFATADPAPSYRRSSGRGSRKAVAKSGKRRGSSTVVAKPSRRSGSSVASASKSKKAAGSKSTASASAKSKDGKVAKGGCKGSACGSDARLDQGDSSSSYSSRSGSTPSKKAVR